MAKVIVRWCNNETGFAGVDVVGGGGGFQEVRFDPNGVKYHPGDVLSCTLGYSGSRMSMTYISRISKGNPHHARPQSASRRGTLPMNKPPRRFR